MRSFGRRQSLHVALAAPLLLGGCASLLVGSRQAPVEYRLRPETQLPAGLPKVDWVLVVAEPTAEGPLDTSRIAIVSDGARVQQLEGAVWADRPTAMLQVAMVQTFQRSGRLPGVGTDRDGLPGRYLLQASLEAFQLEPEGTGFTAEVRLRVLLLNLPSREVAGTTAFARRVPVAGDSTLDAVTAFNSAVGGVLNELVPWTLAGGKSVRARQ